MYYTLNQNIRMCGWDYLETGLVDRRNNSFVFLPPRFYQLLYYCNGQVDLDVLFLNDEQKYALDEMVQQKILIASESRLPSPENWQEYKRYHNRFIRSVQWSITGRCNYRCRHCYMSSPCGKLGELSLEACRAIVDQMADVGILTVSLTGGEALVHPHFWDIVDLILEKGMIIQEIYSNGFLINELFFENCAKRNIKPDISLSFDGVNGAHNWLRGVKDAEVHFRNAVKLINKHEFQYNAEFCLYRKSLETLRESIRFLNEANCTALKINTLSASGEGVRIRDQIVETKEWYKAFLEYIPQYKEDHISMPILACSTYLTADGIKLVADRHVKEEDADRYCLCGHARNSMYITSTGAVMPCVSYSERMENFSDFPNVLKTPLKEILHKSRYLNVITKKLSEFLEEHPKCSACEYKYACVGGCPGRAIQYDTTENPDGVDPEICWYYKNGYDHKLMEISEAVFGRGPGNNTRSET